MFRATLLVLFAATGFAQGLGNWKLNLERSTFDPGPGPVSETQTYEAAPGGQIFTRVWTSRDGRHLSDRIQLIFDGRWHPLERQPHADEICTRQITDRVVVSTFKRRGKMVLTNTRVISEDGKVTTITFDGMGVDGKIHNVRVLERQ